MSSADLDSLDRNIGKEMGLNRDYYAGIKQGRREEQESILMMLETFYKLTQEPDDEGKVTDNPEWDNGFQSAIALIKGEQK